MIIAGNTIIFEQTDIDALPVETQEALADYDAGVTAPESLSAAVNAFLAAVGQLASARSLDRFKAAFDAADDVTRAQAEAKLDEAKVILGVQFVPKEEELTAVK